jgi:magnesium-protoporphyrin IX monomethyl ester (oxidative) cyclase
VLKNLSKTVQAARYFSSSQADLERGGQAFAPHPRQPRGLTPNLSPELAVDGIAALASGKVSRRVKPDAAAGMGTVSNESRTG